MSIAVVDLLQELTDIDTLHESEEGAEVLIDALVSSSHFRLCGIVTCWPWPCHSAQGASVECWLELDGGGAEMQLVGRSQRILALPVIICRRFSPTLI